MPATMKTLQSNFPAWLDGDSEDTPHGDLRIDVLERQLAPFCRCFIVRFTIGARHFWAWEVDLV